MRKKILKHSKEIKFFAKNAPLAIITSSLPGFVNYAVILLLSSLYTMEDVGHYRLLISYFALMGLFSFLESSKIQIRIHALEDEKASTALFFMRLYGIGIATVIVAALAIFESVCHINILPRGLLTVSLLACVYYPTDLFFSLLQAQRRFSLLAGLSLLKYGAALVVFVALMGLGSSVFFATAMQIISMTAFNIAYYLIWAGRTLARNAAQSANPLKLVAMPHTRESFTLSLANWLPSTLEHADKMIIGYFFGIETLGLYTLAFSTGRFIYNSLKPAFYIYYRNFVEKLPPRRLLAAVMAVFTLFGMGLSAAFYVGTFYIPFFTKFQGGEAVVYILFLSYGLAMTDAIYTQSYGINKDAVSRHLLYANITISLFCLSMFAFCVFVPRPMALIICAMHYPIRHAGTLYFLSRLKNKTIKKQT
ncbi:MAG: hypothetical protein WBK77_06565 [Alphaproteobacteria bacterium]